jgi:glutaminase
MDTRSAKEEVSRYVATGQLPDPALIQGIVDEAYERYKTNSEGENSQVYPALAQAPPDLFGISVVGVAGNDYGSGDASYEFTIMSVSKPFVFALVCQALGPEAARSHIGVNPTGKAFNSLEAIRESPDGRTNPMVNPGAIATTSLAPGADAGEKWRSIQDGLSRFAGRSLTVNIDVYESAMATNHRNRELSQMLHERGCIEGDPADAIELYTKQCSLNVTARDLATMGATLGNGGVNPVTGETVIDSETCHYVLAVMTTSGLYETSGDWLYDIGLPGKSGIGGGIVTVSPGKGGLGTFAPRLDAAGNSVKGQLVARHLSRSLGLDLFASSPRTTR